MQFSCLMHMNEIENFYLNIRFSMHQEVNIKRECHKTGVESAKVLEQINIIKFSSIQNSLKMSVLKLLFIL